jgi:hypothetical protein
LPFIYPSVKKIPSDPFEIPYNFPGRDSPAVGFMFLPRMPNVVVDNLFAQQVPHPL